MLSDARVGAALPCQDLERAKNWYKEKLGLSPSEENPGGAYYKCAEGTEFFLFPSAGKSDGSFTQVGFTVTDVEAEVAEFKKAGVTLEQYDMPGLTTDENGITVLDGDKGCFFRDSEGNMIAVFERSS